MSTVADLTREVLVQVTDGRDLDEPLAQRFCEQVMAGEVSAVRLAAVLSALRTKGESVGEITGFARAMRAGAVPVVARRTDLLDTCGTGGDASGSFNISTACALVVAAMGAPVAKHGNRAVSSRCGSADVLEALGVNIELTATQTSALLDEVGLGFLFAPRLHPAMRHAAAARRELGIRTVFNILGPLTNPAGAERQLLGVFAAELCEPLARVLAALGSRRAYVVHGHGGMDEISPLGTTLVAALRDGAIETFRVAPEDLGVARCAAADLAGGEPDENAAHIEAILDGAPGPRTDAVVLNAGFAAVLAELADDPAAGVRLARATLASGAVARKLDELRTASHQLGGGAP